MILSPQIKLLSITPWEVFSKHETKSSSIVEIATKILLNMWLHTQEGVNYGGLKNDSSKKLSSKSEFKNIYKKCLNMQQKLSRK